MRAKLEERRKVLEQRLQEQLIARDQTRAALVQMDAAVQQMQGAIAMLQELLADTEPLEEPMA